MKNLFGIILWSLVLATCCAAQPVVAPEAPEMNTQQSIQVSSIKFSPDGKLLATGMTKKKGRESVGREVRLWDVASGNLLRVLEGKTNQDLAVVFSPDGATLASLGLTLKQNRMVGSQVTLWKTSTGQLLLSLEIPEGETVLSLAFSPDGKVLAGGSISEKDGKPQSQVKLWDAQTGKLNRSFSGLQGCPCGVAFSPDGKLLAAPGWRMNGEDVLGSEVKVWDLPNDKVKQTLTLEKIVVETVVFSPDGKTLATKGSKVGEDNIVGDSDLRLWDVQSAMSKRVLTQEGRSDRVESIDFSSNGKTLMAAGIAFGQKAGSEIWMWNAETGQLVRTLNTDKQFGEGEELTFAADLSPDGKMIALGMGGGTIQLRSAEDGSLIRNFKQEQP